jgi:hypothetical protein
LYIYIFIVEELADVERLKCVFRAYFSDHETYLSINPDDLQVLVDQRAQACAWKYREKLRRLHLSHMDYYLDTIGHYVERTTTTTNGDSQRLGSLLVAGTSFVDEHSVSPTMLSISVV